MKIRRGLNNQFTDTKYDTRQDKAIYLEKLARFVEQGFVDWIEQTSLRNRLEADVTKEIESRERELLKQLTNKYAQQ